MKYNFVNDFDPAGAQGKVLEQIEPNSIVLECGCASGYMTKYMKEKLNCTVYVIEYDREGFDNAIQYAEDGICTDLMLDEWWIKFEHIRFDYILFVDVLEHLREPLRVLQMATSLLSENGKILISIPNIGHNDIVVKLIMGNWNYTSTGLLDDTHVHFWGINDLDSFFKQAGLSIVIKDYSTIATGKTEQYENKAFPADENIFQVIKNRREGEIYQFVLTLQKECYARKAGVAQIDRIPHTGGQSLTNASLQEMQQNIRNLEGHIQLLLQSERELQGQVKAFEELSNSYPYRLAEKTVKVARFFVPKGSKRALLAKMMVTFVKHPKKFLKQINVRNLKLALRLLRSGDLEGIKWRMGNQISGVHMPPSIDVTPPDIERFVMEEERLKTAKEYPVLKVPHWGNPQVSIVIPVYNQFAYTYHCVKSILKNTGNVSYEIIIANDCSTDLTTEIEKIMPGVKLVTTEQNVRFVLNCNNAAKHAKGKYILFLNNDTQVMENWLEPLVSLIESADDIGMVGSKLIYPDGRLQEAGGIFWKDGSAWNYGNRQNPNLPEFNYVKEADYISGASIMIHRSLWEEIGGFDELFVPAYCDDSDLAFTVRKMGYRVMYQPKSVVVHFEGVSNGTDLTSGQKAYQVVNQKKFYEKWKEELYKHPENAVNVFQARDRSYNKKTVLVIDHFVPTFDKDAGSRTIFQYLKLFVSQGYNVKFLGDNFSKNEPYTSVLEEMGVEVLYGPYYAQNWKRWIRENAEKIDYVFLSRPHISIKYVDFLRKNTKAKLVYYGHDLHFWRAEREYEITGDAEQLEKAKHFRKMEFSIYKKVDMVYYLSDLEIEKIRQINPAIPLRRNPINIFETIEKPDYIPEKRSDLLFVGGYAHHPNVDAALYLVKEILPIIRKQYPDIRLHLVGSHPPKEILDLASESVIIDGFVSDERLAEMYQECRIAVVPLRFGAGVKGKVIEAMRYGMPIVTTDTGAEGIPGVENIVKIGNTAEEFADMVVGMLSDDEQLQRRSEMGWEYVQQNLSMDAAIKILGEDFDFRN